MVPARILTLGGMAAVLCVVLLTWQLVSTPWLGVLFDGAPVDGAEGVTAIEVHEGGPAQGLVQPGDRFIALETDVHRIPLDVEAISPEGAYALPSRSQFNDFFTRHEHIYAALQESRVYLVRTDGSRVELAPESRSLGALELSYWASMICGVLAVLVGLGAWIYRPDDGATRNFAIHGLGMFFASTCATVVNHRELTLAPDLFFVLSQVNLFGALLTGFSLVALLWCYPRRITDFPLPPLLYGIAAAVFLAGWFGLSSSPLLLYQIPVTGSMLFGFPALAVVQWLRTRSFPADRAALQWLLTLVGLTMGIIIAANLIPLTLTGDPILPTAAVYVLLLAMYVGLAFGVVRYRLFNLGQWWFEAMIWALSGLLVLVLDAVLLFFQASLSLSLALSLLIAGWAYFPLRQWLWRRINPHARRTIEHHLPELIDSLFTAQSLDQLKANWRRLLGRIYQPLQLRERQFALDGATLDSEGLVLCIPGIQGEGCIELSHPQKGRRLFTSADVRLANAMRALTEQAAVLRRAEDERARQIEEREQEKRALLQDLHDGIGGLATNISLIADLALREDHLPIVKGQLETISNLARETLVEVRSIMHTLDEDEADWLSMVGHFRAVGREILNAQGIEFHMASDIAQNASLPDSLFVLNLYRVYKEILTNVVKHAQATSVQVDLRVDGGQLQLKVQDDGVGYGEKAGHRQDNVMSGGHGLRNMRNRIAHLGGHLEILSGTGTSVMIRVPLQGRIQDKNDTDEAEQEGVNP